jgi:uncharacterized protein YfaS (alpha-2-macroglobulin family)
MKIFLAILAITLTAFLATALAGDPQKEDLKVIYNLSGILQNLENKELVITFSDDMLPLGGKRDGAAIIKIAPAVKGEFTWRGNRTLAFKPETRFLYSATYTATIPAGTQSLSGKTLPRDLHWQWSTPQAFPVEIKTAAQNYFSDLTPGEKLSFQVWVKDAITMRFNQPVSAANANNFMVLKEVKNGIQARFQVVQKTTDEIEIQYAQDLKRGVDYQLIMKKGFCGSEGSTGTGKDFAFTFATVPAFNYSGAQTLIVFPDMAYCRLAFSNPLKEVNRDLIKVFKTSGGQHQPMAFDIENRYYDTASISLNINKELSSADELSILVDKNLINAYNEHLPENLALTVRVCSSYSPRIQAAMQGKKLSLTVKSMKKAGIQLIKLKPDFVTQLHKEDFGILQQKNFKNEFIEKEILQDLENLPEKENTLALRDNELGSPLGFYGVLVRHFEPYNACKDISLMRLPVFFPLELQVFHRRNMDMVVKTSPGQTLYWLYDNESGKGVGQKQFFIRRNNITLPIGESTANGILLDEKGLSGSDLVMAKNSSNGDMALARIDHSPESSQEIKISLFSDRDFYRPGDTVYIGGIVKEFAWGKISSPQLKSASLEISGPDGQKVKTAELQLDPWGGFKYEFKSEASGKKGRYQILVRQQNWHNWQSQHNVTIDYYQPNIFELTIAKTTERYLPQDNFGPEIRGSYLAGNPMAGENFEYSLTLAPATSRVFDSMELKRYDFGLDRDLVQNDPPAKGEKKLDAEGKHILNIPLTAFNKTNYLANLGFSATGKSNEGKEFTASTRSLFFPGNLLTGIRVGFYQNLNDTINTTLALVDAQGKPVSGEIRVSLYQEYYENYQRKLKKVTGPEDIYVDKTKTHSFRAPTAGHFVLRCDTPDNSGRVVSTSGHFFAWDSNFSDREEQGLQIQAEHNTIKIGEKLTCYIRSPKSGQALVTIERGTVQDSRVIDLQKMTPLEIQVKKEYFPAFRVSIIAMFENNVSEETYLDFRVASESKTLRVALDVAEEIHPASQAKLKIKVSDEQKRGVKAKLFVYAVDEGNLSLRGYQAPDPHEYLYYFNFFRKSPFQTYYSKNNTQWTFERPLLDIELGEPGIFGCIFRSNASPMAAAAVTLEDKNHKLLKSTTTSAEGYYCFSGMPAGYYAIKAEAKGFHPFLRSDLYHNGSGHTPCDLTLIPARLPLKNCGNAVGVEGGVDGGIEGGVMGAMVAPSMPMAAEMKSSAQSMKKEMSADMGILGGGNVDISGIRVRSDFKEVLFFKSVETDETGNALVDFASSDQLSTYRIMAVAYNEDSFGKTEKGIMVSKDLLISEAMPEFARQDDEFKAGVQLSNRTAQRLAVTLLAKPEGIGINGAAQIERSLSPRSNDLFQYLFLADRSGEAKIEFFAISAADKDGLQKKLPVTDNMISETLLDFASGRSVLKKIQPQAEGENQAVNIKVTPSLLKPAANIAKKLVFYPYECLEQRASKVMPYLALSQPLVDRLDLGLDKEQIRQAVTGYLRIIPEFMNREGALSYYRGGQYSSDYLTAYVLWGLQLAKARGYQVEPQLVQKLGAYLQRADLDKTTESFYQFVLSLNKQADGKKLKKMFAEREAIPLTGRVFLYRALHNQAPDANRNQTMLAEFNNSLQIEADFAYFDVREFSYNRDFPFYSSRFVTAILLQAILEVEHGYVLAEKIINWLLEGEPYNWNTTQTNFWILCAMDEYLTQVEKTTARKAEITLLGEKTAKEFLNSRDTLQVSKKLNGRKDLVEVSVNADQPVYVTSELTYQLARAKKKSRGIDIQRLVYAEKGQTVENFKRGQIYQVELLVKTDKEIPYGVIDEPLAAGFELLRQDIGTTRTLSEFNSKNRAAYHSPWLRQENSADRLVFYTYSMQGNLRFVYFIKALYSGRFTWLPTVAQGMYHPQYFGRTDTKMVVINE